MNDILDEYGVLNKNNFASIHLPNEGGFTVDTRVSSPLMVNSVEPCVQNCKESVEITKRARVLDVTPDSG